MKKVINGKLYNTETAESLAVYETPDGRLGDDFDVVREALYRTKKGAYFLHGRGFQEGWGSPQTGGGFCMGQNLRALSRAEALEWAERREIDADDIVDEFEVDEA